MRERASLLHGGDAAADERIGAGVDGEAQMPDAMSVPGYLYCDIHCSACGNVMVYDGHDGRLPPVVMCFNSNCANYRVKYRGVVVELVEVQEALTHV